MRLRRGYFALATLSGLTLVIYSCSSDNKSSGTTGAGTVATTTGSGTIGGTTGAGTVGTTGATMGTTGATTGGLTTGAGGGTSTGMGGASAGGTSSTTDGGAGEGGEAPVGGCEDPAGMALYAFDEPGLEGWSIRATDDNESGLADSFVMRNGTEGVSCPGSMVLTVPFSVYGPNESAEAQANFTADWSGYTTLYASVKVQMPAGGSLGYLNGVQLFTNSADYSMYHGQFASGRTFEDFEWHEISLDLTMDTDLTNVNQLGIQLLVWEDTATAMDPGGVADPPAAPETTVVYIDDIRLE